MLSRPDNRKLGPRIHSFSLPAHDTCPGETEACAGVCYACRQFFTTQGVIRKLKANYEATLQPEFVPAMIQEIRHAHAQVVRLQVSGDLYNEAYIRSWITVAKRLNQTEFGLYSRSWRILALLPALNALSKLPNVHLWWSVDADTHRLNGRPPQWKGVRVAFLQRDYDEPIPAYADLVFRHKRKRIAKYVNGRLVCPAENGVKTKFKITCSDCMLCYRDRKVPRKDCVPSQANQSELGLPLVSIA